MKGPGGEDLTGPRNKVTRLLRTRVERVKTTCFMLIFIVLLFVMLQSLEIEKDEKLLFHPQACLSSFSGVSV